MNMQVKLLIIGRALMPSLGVVLLIRETGRLSKRRVNKTTSLMIIGVHRRKNVLLCRFLTVLRRILNFSVLALTALKQSDFQKHYKMNHVAVGVWCLNQTF